MPYSTEHPDFDRQDIAAMLVAAGWRDRSWRNEPCPSFVAGGACLFVDYANPELREFPDCEDMVSIHFLNHRGEFTEIPPQGFATMREALGALYEGLIGYNPFVDDPAITEREVAQTIVEWFEARDS